MLQPLQCGSISAVNDKAKMWVKKSSRKSTRMSRKVTLIDCTSSSNSDDFAHYLNQTQIKDKKTGRKLIQSILAVSSLETPKIFAKT